MHTDTVRYERRVARCSVQLPARVWYVKGYNVITESSFDKCNGSLLRTKLRAVVADRTGSDARKVGLVASGSRVRELAIPVNWPRSWRTSKGLQGNEREPSSSELGINGLARPNLMRTHPVGRPRSDVKRTHLPRAAALRRRLINKICSERRSRYVTWPRLYSKYKNYLYSCGVVRA